MIDLINSDYRIYSSQDLTEGPALLKQRSELLASFPKLLVRSDLHKLLDHLGIDGLGVEIGVCFGEYSNYLLNYTKLKTLFSVDPWEQEYEHRHSNDEQDRFYKQAVILLQRYGDRSKIIRRSSAKAVTLFQDRIFDFVYIDANHAYDFVSQDMRLWWPKLKIGGLFAGHDYSPEIQQRAGNGGVIRAVDEFVQLHSLKLNLTEERFATWYFLRDV